MSNLDDVKSLLNTLGVRKKILESEVVRTLASKMKDGEKIAGWCAGVIENNGPAAIFVFATNLNLHLVDLKTASATQLPLESIQKVRLKTGARSLISLTTSNQSIEIKAFDPKRVSAIAHFINSTIPNTEPLVDENPHAGKPFPKWRALFLVFLALLFYVIYGTGRGEHKTETQTVAAPTSELVKESSSPSERVEVSRDAVDCHELYSYAQAQGHNFIEIAEIVTNAKKMGRCYDKN